MSKLNRNQLKFFDVSISHFGDKSSDVSLKEIRDFSESAGLIIPTTKLNTVCKIERGRYDLTKSGVVVEPDLTVSGLSTYSEPVKASNIIQEMPVYASFPDTRTNQEKQLDINRKDRVKFINPIWILQNDDGDIVCVGDNFQVVYDKIYQVLGDGGVMNKREAFMECEAKHGVNIKSVNSNLFALITKHNLQCEV